jgi:hypothetical protein
MTNVIYYRVAGDENVHCPDSVHRVCIHCEGETFFLMTKEQYNKWQKWGITEIKKQFKYNTTIAEREMGMVSLMWGLKFSDFPK